MRPLAANDTTPLKSRAPRATAILPPESHTEATKPLPRIATQQELLDL